MHSAHKSNLKFKDYIAIARPDHWVKHIFIVPGIILAGFIVGFEEKNILWTIAAGILSACCISSANYVLNELCDAQFDGYHPVKKDRPLASKIFSLKAILAEYFLLTVIGLFIAKSISNLFFITSLLFLIMGVIYNVRPFRLKDSIYLDVITEAVNNPIRLLLGWSMVSSVTLPPMSLLILFWAGGAYLMTTKRLAEYRYIIALNRKDELGQYRASFKNYTENSLLVAAFLYGLLSAFLISVFLMKYRHEYLFVFPFFALLFAYYLYLALKKDERMQSPEKLHEDRALIMIVVLIIFLLMVFALVDLPVADWIVKSDLMKFPF